MDIILSKESSESEIKRYFNAVLELSKSDNEYPINLEDVCMLVYSEKSKAVRALRENFIENVDFITVSQNGEGGKFARTDYYLTVSCMEFFIARKVRPVFEVYRRVFHKSVEYVKKLKEPTVVDKIAVADWLTGFLNLNESSKLLIAKSIAEPLGLPMPDYTHSYGVLKSASELLKEHGSPMSAQTFNAKLIELGYLVEFTRPSRVNGKSVVKKFKSITPKGMEYGENQVNPNNPKSTQPLWYADRFNELLALAR